LIGSWLLLLVVIEQLMIAWHEQFPINHQITRSLDHQILALSGFTV